MSSKVTGGQVECNLRTKFMTSTPIEVLPVHFTNSTFFVLINVTDLKLALLMWQYPQTSLVTILPLRKIDITKAWLSKIIYTFPRPLRHRRENRAKHHPKLILSQIEIKFNYFSMFKG